MAKTAKGRGENYDTAEMEILYRVFTEWCARQSKMSDQEIGDRIGVSQQTANKLRRRKMAGMTRQTAMAITKLAGFDSADALLDAQKRRVGMRGLTEDRDIAERCARQLGIPEDVIGRVNLRFVDTEVAARKLVSRYIDEYDSQLERAERESSTRLTPRHGLR